MKQLSAWARTAALLLSIVSLTNCEGDGSKTPASVTGVPRGVATVAVTPTSASVAVGATTQLSSLVLDASGAALAGHSVAWSSSNPSVATVSTSGLVTGVAAGAASVTATSEGKSGVAAILVLAPVANAFNPTASTTITGKQRFASINIPAGVTVTAASDLDLSASGPITIAGALTGDCVAMAITADGAASVTGIVSNACADPSADGKDLIIAGKGQIAVNVANVKSSGDILLTNDLTLTDASFPAPSSSLITVRGAVAAGKRMAAKAVAADPPDCTFSGVRPVPAPARVGAPMVIGADGKRLKMSCHGNGQIGGPAGAPVGATITAQSGGAGGAVNAVSNSFAEARAGDGGSGGSLSVFVTGDLTIAGATTLVSGDGGNGGAATATGVPNPSLIKQPSAQATGGRGGEPGLVDIRVGGSLDINAALNIVIGHGGNGGDAGAWGANGLDATDISPAKEGGDARPTGGEGGSTPNRKLTATGDVTGLANVTVSGGNAGNAGSAAGTAGIGGNGNQTFPAGGKGGDFLFNRNNAWNGSNAHVGNGGNAQLKDLAGVLFGRGGNGSVTNGRNGNGGQGWSDCGPVKMPGGPGGPGGSAAGRDGKGGSGAPAGVDGGITFTNAGNGGNGGNGEGPGAGGAAGVDRTTSSLPKTLIPPDFTPGMPGNACPDAGGGGNGQVAVDISVQSDPNGHEQFVGYTRVTSLNVVSGGMTIMITGPAPWVTVSGLIEGNTFIATGTGTVAGFSNVPVKFTGSISTTGAISGTIQIGQSTPPTGLPNGPVTYTVSPRG